MKHLMHILLFIFVVGVVAVLTVSSCISVSQGEVMALKWGQRMNYQVEGVVCAVSGLSSRALCAVRIRDQVIPLSLECASTVGCFLVK